MQSVLICEVVMTAIFLIVILGSTAKRAAGAFDARSTGPALLVPGAMGDLWLFWVAPIVGAIVGAVIYNLLLSDE